MDMGNATASTEDTMTSQLTEQATICGATIDKDGRTWTCVVEVAEHSHPTNPATEHEAYDHANGLVTTWPVSDRASDPVTIWPAE
jgi:hypothetical protein